MPKPAIADLRDVGSKAWSLQLAPEVALNAVSFSPQGNVLALVCLNLVVLVDAASGEELARIDQLEYFRNVVLWLDGGSRLAVQVPGKLRCYRCDDWSFERELDFSDWSTDPDVDRSGQWIASAFRVIGDGDARGYEGFGSVSVRSIDDWPADYGFRTNRECGGLAWSPRDQLTLWDPFDRISIWDIAAKAMVQEAKLPEDRVASVAWHPSGDTFVVGSMFAANLYVFDAGSGELRRRLEAHDDEGGIHLASFSGDGKRFVSKDSGYQAQTVFWDAETWEPLCAYRPHGGGARRRVPLGAMGPDGGTVLTLNDACTGIDAWSLPV